MAPDVIKRKEKEWKGIQGKFKAFGGLKTLLNNWKSNTQIDSGIPGWKTLIEEMKDEIEISNDEQD